MDKDVTRFVHLVPANSSQPQKVQDDNMPRNGTYPTSQWQPGEFIDERINLNLSGIPGGDYQLLVGFYERLPDHTFPRLTAVATNGAPLPNNQYIIPEIIHIP
jgi:hypothetical protein